MIRVTEIAFTGYPVTDVARARAFYEGLIGLKPATTYESEGSQWIEYELGTGTFAISNTGWEKWKPSQDGPAVAFEVENFESAVETLRQRSVAFVQEPIESPICWLCVIRDPDGNLVTIHRRKDHPTPA